MKVTRTKKYCSNKDLETKDKWWVSEASGRQPHRGFLQNVQRTLFWFFLGENDLKRHSMWVLL